jgi:predicted nuclease of predicted toxin-antitoxin system
MNLYLDDNLSIPALAATLQKAGHQVVRPADAHLLGVSDARHLEFAIRSRLVLLTADRNDFRELHDLVQASGGTHSGILLVRFQNDVKRDMKPKHIVRAISKLQKACYQLTNSIVVLNQWR